jgi:hypothetical protein
MKKLLLISYFLGVIACIGYSQSLSLSNENGPVANDSYINKSGLPTDDEIVVEMFVTNNTADPIPVMVKKVETSMVPGTASLFCWGLCFAPSVYVSPDPLTINGNTTNETDFSGHYLPSGIPGMSVIRYVFFDQRNPNDSVCFNTNFQAYPLGISGLTGTNALSAYPNPASSKVTIAFAGMESASGKVIIRNLLGENVKEIAVSGTSGKVLFDATDLNSGIYFYSLVINGNAVATKKLVVRH